MIDYYNKIKIFFLFICVIFSFYAVQFYQGSKLLFIFFNLVVLFFTHYSTNSNKNFFSIFIAIYFFLGFWFKYNLSLVFNNGLVYDSGMYAPANNIDKVLIITIYLSFTLIIATLLSNYSLYIKENSFLPKKNLYLNFYYKNQKTILFLFLLISLFFCYINYEYQIYLRGFESTKQVSKIITYPIIWFLVYGLSTLGCFFLYNEFFSIKKYVFQISLIIFLTLALSNISILSRNMVLLTLPVLLPFIYYKLSNKLFKIIISVFFLFLFFTFFSTYFVNKIRVDKLNFIYLNQKTYIDYYDNLVDAELKKNLENRTKTKFDFQINEFEKNTTKFKHPDAYNVTLFIIINRWIGIDSLINLSQMNNLGPDLLFEALKEEKKTNQLTFYEKLSKKMSIDKKIIISEDLILKGNTLPGIFSFLYYSGSIFFLCSVIFFLVLFFNFFEKVIYKMSNKNIFFSSFISFNIVHRLFHFGYAPKESYLFFISILLSIVMIVLINFFFSSKNRD